MKIEPRSLPIAEEIIKSTGLQMTYPYDDLVFVEHNPFILRFNNDKPEQFFIHFNKDCYENDKANLLRLMERKAYDLGAQLVTDKNYMLSQKENKQEMELKFL